MSATPSHVTFGQAARLVGVSGQSVRYACDRGQLHLLEYMGVQMVPHEEVVRWIEERRQRARKVLRRGEVVLP